MLLHVATASLLARRAYNSLQYSLYYAVFHYLLFPPDLRRGRESLVVQLMYFGVVWRNMTTSGAAVPQRVITILLLVFLQLYVHPEDWISDFPMVKMILQYSICTELILWGNFFLCMFIISSQNSQFWMMRWAARLERLDHKLWITRNHVWGILYDIALHCSWDVALWVSLKCFGFRKQKLICRLTAWIICRLVFSKLIVKFCWWMELILIVVSSPISSILHQCWNKATLYLLEEELFFLDAEEYKYRPLQSPNHIRLLVIYPWTIGTITRCKLIQVSMDEYPIYEALSYTWGNNQQTERIMVNGNYLNVPQNAFKAITGISSKFLPRVIWIDSICINQSDKIERSKQVLLMERIYSQAFEVTVWIGSYHFPEQGGEGVAKVLLRPLGLHFREDYDDDTLLLLDAHMAVDMMKEFLFSKHMDDDTRYKRSLAMVGSSRAGLQVHSWRALRRFLCHPWFERIWVVQEVALARNVRVLYGGEEIDWRTVALGLGRMFHELQAETALVMASSEQTEGNLTIPPGLQNILSMESIRQQVQCGRKLTYPEALKACSFFKATDPRDRIFGIRSICSSLPEHLMIPDYTVSTEAVYINAAESLIKERHFDHVFGYAGVGMTESNKECITGLPSWVPDWTTPPLSLPFAFVSCGSGFKAGGDFAVRIKLDAGHRLLMAGVFLNAIVDLGPQFGPRLIPDSSGILQLQNLGQQYEDSWNLLERSSRTLDIYPFTSPPQPIREVFWRSLVGDQSKNSYPALPEFGNVFENLLKYFGQLMNSPTNSTGFRANDKQSAVNFPGLHQTVQFAEFEEMTKRGIMGRRLFISKNGYVGTCPPYSQAGDIVCVVPGFRTPILLRLMPNSNHKRPCYQHVGECYVHGLMQGEALAGLSTLQQFLIS